ncbi:MAG: hypothetical protein NTNFB02_23160 [Nitrospira sp.]
MQNIFVSFGIRLKSNQSISVIGERAERVLGCRFTCSEHPDYPDSIILKAEAFCLRLWISQGPLQGDPPVQIYQLNGENVIEPRWNYTQELDLTPWVLQEFQKRDSPDWYIPTLDELKKEANID